MYARAHIYASIVAAVTAGVAQISQNPGIIHNQISDLIVKPHDNNKKRPPHKIAEEISLFYSRLTKLRKRLKNSATKKNMNRIELNRIKATK